MVPQVNGWDIEMDRIRAAAGVSSTIFLDKKMGTLQNSSVADPMSEPTDNSSVSGKRMKSIEAVPIHDQKSLEAIPMHEESSQEAVPVHDQSSLEPVPLNAERISSDTKATKQTAVIPNSSETHDSGEIVQIPLDENEARELELHVAEKSRNTPPVPLTDAPLIGAPFRFISFVAKYVSGADLVANSSANQTMKP